MPPKKPVDIFAAVEQPAARQPVKPPARKPVPVAPVARPAAQPVAAVSHTRRLVIILILAALLVGGVAAVVSLNRLQPSTTNQPTVIVNQATGTNTDETEVNEVTNEATVTVDPIVITPGATDSDTDGLSDETEAQLGTKADQPDSDGDGLFDREETQYYKSDPNKTDSDGDGNTDGEEVSGGYSPTGPGNLLDIPGTIESLTNNGS